MCFIIFIFPYYFSICVLLFYFIIFCNPFSAWRDFRRQNLTSKVGLLTKRLKIFDNGRIPISIRPLSNQIKRSQLKH